MRNLRPCPGGERYCIPSQGLYEFATAAQYFTELVAWTGFWLMSFGPNGLYILCVSLGNLIPRAATTHAWYVKRFPEYEGLGRARLFPFVW